MTDQSLAQASDIAVWVTMVLLTVAMLAFAAHLAITGSRRDAEARAASEGIPRAGSGGTVDSTLAQVRDGAPGAGDPGSGGSGSGVAVLDRAESSPPPTRRWGVIGLQVTWLATFALMAAVALRGLAVERAPLGNMYEFALVAAMFTLIVFSLWSLRRDRLWLGLFVTLPVLLILGLAKISWYTEASDLMPSLNSIWLWIHVSVATLSVALFTIGAVLALLYLAKDRAQAKGEVTGWLAALPSVPSLERITYGIHIIAFPLWTFTLIAGAIWAEQAWGRYWGWDPKEVWTFVIWVVYAAYLHARATAGWTVRKATWLAVAGFVCIMINYGVVNLFFVGWHSYSGV
ncbi:c-type cytochrome biogenesis protein CcsB [Ornithinimicrobium cryptoxanthini]|uniref:C-type cytochrome biogenesis protein CcsB n=1 Tax=Ornithinimicrobium cryptoxanthini TaxID=2934161 RepID=A0ABY4YJ02_9MICO|nr:c-type cytochrome biogenesis protein CcsB [Ornithinimicrobium cryptoxanthini]USQ76762.1 c-type cytochrome biogenesis protein CcsB [Ornithinimicrobium cryptoxanthini]